MRDRKVIVLTIAVLIWVALCVPDYRDTAAYVWKSLDRPVVVVDAGHGGADGGASAMDGTAEKDINLLIALSLREKLEDAGVKVIMTRKDDDGLYKGNKEGSIRSLKVRDMKERASIIDDAGAELTVSIHLNSFTQDRSVKGAQVFFSSSGNDEATERSRLAADNIQRALNERINTEKSREIQSKNDVYLMRDISTPIVIVECGFLSNAKEASALKTREYRDRIAESLNAGICGYLNSTESEK